MDGMICCCVTVKVADADADVVDFVLDIGGTKISGKWMRANMRRQLIMNSSAVDGDSLRFMQTVSAGWKRGGKIQETSDESRGE